MLYYFLLVKDKFVSTKCKNAVIGQSGGPSSAINSTLSGAILGLLDCSYVDTVYGMKNGIEGFLKKDLVILNSVPRDEIYALAKTPACALGSCRFKLIIAPQTPAPMTATSYCIYIPSFHFTHFSTMNIIRQ